MTFQQAAHPSFATAVSSCQTAFSTAQLTLLPAYSTGTTTFCQNNSVVVAHNKTVSFLEWSLSSQIALYTAM